MAQNWCADKSLVSFWLNWLSPASALHLPSLACSANSERNFVSFLQCSSVRDRRVSPSTGTCVIVFVFGFIHIFMTPVPHFAINIPLLLAHTLRHVCFVSSILFAITLPIKSAINLIMNLALICGYPITHLTNIFFPALVV